MNVGNRIVELRSKQNLTTNRLANLCGLSQSFIRSVELGEKGISVEKLELVCDALKISLRDFFDAKTNIVQDTDSLPYLISCLSSEQRDALAAFLKTI